MRANPTWLFLGVVIFSVWAVSCGWTHNILDAHGFRQTQTAMSAYYMVTGGPFLAYQTPVLGPPWSIPFEFPLYQGLVALAVPVLRLDLEPAGRLVSVTFFYLTLLPLWWILNALHVRRHHRLVVLSFVLVSPLFLFWSRAFMIESTALFLSVAYLALVMRFLQRPGVASGLAALVCGCLGGLVKITTFYGFWLAAAAFAVHSIWRDRRIKPGVLVSAACLYGMPVLAALLWTRYTDHVRAMNPFAGFITGVPLKQWTLGSLEQRLMLYPTWWVISVRTINDVTGSRAFYLTFATIAWSRKYTAHYAVCIALYIAGMMTFTNLHVIHEYYPYGVGLFVIAAQGFAICSLLEGNRHQRIAGTTMLSLFLMLSGWAYLAGYHKLQRRENTGLTPFATRVAELSRANDVLILYGFDWSPELPYYAQRRALMVRRVDELTPDKVAGAKKAITDLGFRVGPLIACNLPPAVLRAQLALWGADPYQGVAIGGCRAYR